LRLTACLNLPAPGRSQSVYVGLDNALARSCVFAKQSLGTILCGRSLLPLTGHILPAPLIPKLRGNFAEFLLRKSLEHLRLLASPTCVGLRYGRKRYSRTRLFSAASFENPWKYKYSTRHPVSPLTKRIYLPCQATPLHRDVQHPTALLLPRPPLRSDASLPAREYSPVSHRLRLSPST
jgi:hypothetical protein